MCLVLVWRQTTYESWITEARQQYMHNPNRQHTATFDQHTLMANAHVVGQPFYLVTVSGCKLIAHCTLHNSKRMEKIETTAGRWCLSKSKTCMTPDLYNQNLTPCTCALPYSIIGADFKLGTGWPQGNGLVVCTEYKNSHALHNMSQGCKSLGCLWKRLGSLRKNSMWPNKYVRIPSVQVSRPFF